MKPLRIEIDATANAHCHLRHIPAVMRDSINLSILAGIDVLGPMPNLPVGLTTARQVVDYIDVAKSLVPKGKSMHFMPIGMVTEQTTRADIDAFLKAGIRNFKIYPLFRTTQSETGVRDYYKLVDVVRYGGERGAIFHFHPEHPWMTFENRDAEYQFLPIIDMFLRETKAILVWEHGTDARCIPFWKEMAKTGRFFVTLTAHHLLTNESKSFGVVQSVCKPPIKTEWDRLGLCALIREGHVWVILGADDAPHDRKAKHKHDGEPCACGAATTRNITALCAHALDDLLQTEEGIQTFVNFTSANARKLHNLPPPSRKITLVRKPSRIALYHKVGPWIVENFWPGKTIDWCVEN